MAVSQDVTDRHDQSLVESKKTGVPGRVVVNPDGSSVGDSVWAVQVVESGTTTYVGEALSGTATSASSWRIKKIDESSGTVITWADGDTNFDNVWDDYASLTYS